jgi:hypothetical protein
VLRWFKAVSTRKHADQQAVCYSVSNLGSLAQLVEQLAFNQLVDGSNPSRPTITQGLLKSRPFFCLFFTFDPPFPAFPPVLGRFLLSCQTEH